MKTIKDVEEELIKKINKYQQSPNYNSIELGIVINDLLHRLPRDVVYEINKEHNNE